MHHSYPIAPQILVEVAAVLSRLNLLDLFREIPTNVHR